MTTQTTEARIAARRAHLAKLRAEQDELDLPHRQRARQVREYIAETAALDQQIAALNAAVAALAALPAIDADAAWRDHLVTWRQTLNAELLAMPPRIRNEKELEQQQCLVWSIRLIDRGFDIAPFGVVDLSPTRIGQLMTSAGYEVQGEALRGPRGWRGSLPEVEGCIKALAKQRTAAEAALDSVLLDDAERAKTEAESQLLAAAFNAMNVRMGHDGRLVAYDQDGAVLDGSKLTRLQRKAIERMDAPGEPVER